MTGTTKFKVLQGCFVAFLTLASLAVLYPIIFVISTAFSPKNSVTQADIIPFKDGFSLKQFQKLFGETDFLLWFKNTLLIAIGVMIVTVLVCALAAYVFSRFKFAFKKSMMMAMLILQIFPSFVSMQALYVIADRIGAHDQLWGLVLIYAAGNVPYNTWLVKSYLDTIPKSLDEAARIDGANHVTIFFRVVLPIAKPIIIFLAITSFTGPWMDWIFPKLLLSTPEKYTLAMGLINFIDGTRNQFTTFAAGAITVAVPFIFFFIFSQKEMMTGLGGGAVKE
jgi:arabinogalactan oligomer/maltooligosaccharide transport system permease protein